MFDRAYSSCPLCSPNRACLLTGRQPGATNVFTNCKPDVDAHLKEDTLCVSDVLKREGYSPDISENGIWTGRTEGEAGMPIRRRERNGTALISGIPTALIMIICIHTIGIRKEIISRSENGRRNMRPMWRLIFWKKTERKNLPCSYLQSASLALSPGPGKI